MKFRSVEIRSDYVVRVTGFYVHNDMHILKLYMYIKYMNVSVWNSKKAGRVVCLPCKVQAIWMSSWKLSTGVRIVRIQIKLLRSEFYLSNFENVFHLADISIWTKVHMQISNDTIYRCACTQSHLMDATAQNLLVV